MIRIADRHPESVMKAMMNVKAEYSEHFNEVFKTITTDNSSEFASLSELDKAAETMIYYAHPYTSSGPLARRFASLTA